MKSLTAIILAAGLGRRMKSKQAKVLHPLAGRPMVTYPVERAQGLGIDKIVVVVGHQAERVKEVLAPLGVEVVHQAQPRGTGDAVLQTREALTRIHGPILILNGDAPLITEQTLKRLIKTRETEKATLTLLTAVLSEPEGYGRVIRDRSGQIRKVMEEKDATPSEQAIREINTGFYIVDRAFLFDALESLKTDNSQREYYLTDIVAAAAKQHVRLAAVRLDEDVEEVMGVNTRMDLALAEKIMRRRIVSEHLQNGVTLIDPDTTWIDAGVRIGRDTVIHPNVQIEGKSRIGEDCVIRSHTRLTDCHLGSGVVIKDSCVLTESILEDGASVGPFAHLRPGTALRKGARIGNFVEAKKTELGEGSKANHLTYLGDATIGKGVNIGAGTITCNYDGVKKHETIIEDGVFVGSDTQLVAPVKIGRGAVIGAGSTITKDVPPDALAVARVRQVNKPGWAKKRRSAVKNKNRA
ncbi:MAG TPA: bifunctional UDP-N-acetylglucosamine diphosphorylase/glucosamine-1-phosphate N-acetyltransferase GlmU [Nitrospiria bacterium]|nr:bifunctional UDP-N-acetylglucosamine diphosphorylase/glucosamine-1-phosphate N-acetyltransferase GlmU [Nitrospiria bacterium]